MIDLNLCLSCELVVLNTVLLELLLVTAEGEFLL